MPAQPAQPAPVAAERVSTRKRKPIDQFVFTKYDKKKEIPIEQRELQYMKWDGTNHHGRETADCKIVHLTIEWVDWVWPPDDEEAAEVREGWMKDNFNKWTLLTCGDARHRPIPPPTALDPELMIAYPQRNNTCLASAFASVLHLAGHMEAASKLNQNIYLESLKKGNRNLIQDFVNAVNSSKISANHQPIPGKKPGPYLRLYRINSSYDPINGPTPAVMVMQTFP